MTPTDAITPQEWNRLWSEAHAGTTRRYANQGAATVRQAFSRLRAAASTNPTPGNLGALAALANRLAAFDR